MKSVLTKKRWARRMLLMLLALCGLALVYLAYVYQPPEDRRELPTYKRQIHSQFVNAGPFRIHYLHVGQGAPVVLIPGGGTWIYELRTLTSALASRYSVYALDPPGDGYTVPLAAHPSYDLPTIDSTLLHFLDALHLFKVALIGHSFGGGYALSFTERYPSRVRQVILLDSVGLNLPYVPFFEAMKWPLVGELTTKFITPDLMRQQLQTCLFSQQKITTDMVQERYIPATFRSNREAFYQLVRELDWKQTEQLLPQVRVPLLLIWGKQDQLQPVDRLTRWHQLDPRAHIIVLDHAGHCVQEDQPQQVDQLVQDFLKGDREQALFTKPG